MAYEYSLVILGVVAVIYVALRLLMHSTQDPEEPPVILEFIPFLSPILELVTRRYKIYMHLLYKLPIFTLRLPFSRLYIIHERSLISSIERNAKIISFAPIEAEATINLLGLSEKANAALRRDLTSENGHFTTFHRAIRPALAPGPGLDSMIQTAIQSLTVSVNETRGKTSVVSLFKWVRHEIIMASTDAEFGPDNPFRDPAFEKAWYAFDPAVPVLSVNCFPKLLARQGLEAREFLAEGFLRYFRQGGHRQASAGLKARLAHSLEAGFTEEDIARGEIGAALASLNNSVPAVFWMIYHIYSNPTILRDCRWELEGAIRRGQDFHTIDLSYVKDSCPILQSTFQETIRYRGVGALIIRRVVEDNFLDNRYLLKKGNIVLIPNSVQHFRSDVWGPEAEQFQHTRFLQPGSKGPKRYDPTAFRPFGAGSLLCPGRHFATTEILSFAALVITSLEIKPVEGDWAHGATDRSFGMGVARIFLLPQKDLEVELCYREDRHLQVE